MTRVGGILLFFVFSREGLLLLNQILLFYMCKIKESIANVTPPLRKLSYLMENAEMNNVDQKQRDKRFYMITLALFLPLAAVLKVYFFLR